MKAKTSRTRKIRGMTGEKGRGVRSGFNPVALCLLAIGLCLVSCRSGYVHLNYEAHAGAVRNADRSSQIAFVTSTSAYLPAAGISRFPDGGMAEYLLQDVSLYTLDTKTGQITKHIDFNDLAQLIGFSKSKWKIRLGFKGSAILYRVGSVNHWDLQAKWKKRTIPSEQVGALKKKYEQCYLFDIDTKKTKIVEAQDFQKALQKSSGSNRVSLTQLNRLLKNIELAQLGLIANAIMPKTENEYIDETIYLKNDSNVTRRAVVEQIISNKSDNEIEALLEKMDRYKSGLKGAKRQQFEISSQETYSAIQKLLHRDCQTLIHRADHHFQIEEYVEADRIYRQAIDCRPDSPEIWNALGETNYKGGRIEPAGSAFTAALELDPGYIPALRNLSIMAIDFEDYAQALKFARKAHRLDPSDEQTSALILKLENELGAVTELSPSGYGSKPE